MKPVNIADKDFLDNADKVSGVLDQAGNDLQEQVQISNGVTQGLSTISGVLGESNFEQLRYLQQQVDRLYSENKLTDTQKIDLDLRIKNLQLDNLS